MDADLVKLRVKDVRVAVPAGNGVEAGMVVLEEEGFPFRTLRMYIGQPEARAINVAWSEAVPPRPSTWDLFVSTIALLDGRIERAVITDVEEERHFFAQLVIQRTGDETPLYVTARPSDALALALRSPWADICAEEHVLEDAGLLSDGSRWTPSAEPIPEVEGAPEYTTAPEFTAPPEDEADAAAVPAPAHEDRTDEPLPVGAPSLADAAAPGTAGKQAGTKHGKRHGTAEKKRKSEAKRKKAKKRKKLAKAAARKAEQEAAPPGDGRVDLPGARPDPPAAGPDLPGAR